MPGPVSDSYDPEFSTGSNADAVAEAVRDTLGPINEKIGPLLKNIIHVVNGDDGETHNVLLTEKQLRLIRFAVNRALESL